MKQLGLFPSIPDKTIPGSNVSATGDKDYSILYTEEEKYEDNMNRIKKLIYRYEWISRQQINKNRPEIRKLFNLAYGVIDVEDYIKSESEYSTELNFADTGDVEYDLEFFPIIPSIVNALTSELSKKYVNFSAIAVNREAINEVIKQKNNALRASIIEPLQRIYQQDLEGQGITPEAQPDVFQEKMQLFQQMPEIQKYHTKEYRLEVEQWANHKIANESRRLGLEELSRQIFFNKIVTDLPFVHVNMMDGDVKAEEIDPRYASYLRSPYLDDVSNSIMFHWFEYESPLNIISRVGTKLRPEDIEKLEKLHIYYKTVLTNDTNARYSLDTPGILESAQNFLGFKQIGDQITDDRYRGDEYKERLLEISNMYLQIPRKLGELTIKGEDGSTITKVVDDTYKVTITPQYNGKKELKNLVSGEHLEWFYINEVWRCMKINLSVNPNPANSDDIWVILEKYPVQLSKLGQKFGSYIPVHGGPKTNKYGVSTSVVKKCRPWQVLHNFLWNRNKQKLETEIGKFFAMNQNMVPKTSMGEDWGPQNFIKFAVTAKETGIGPMDNSVANTGQTTMGLTGGMGQVVDLTVTQEVLEKAKLAEVCKQECLNILGLSPQFVSDISPSETAMGISQGIERSFNSIKHLFDEHFKMMQLVYQTLLECHAYLDMQKDDLMMNYINDEGERVIFSMDPSQLILSQLGIYVSSSLDDNILLENIKKYVLTDNTLGADIQDKLALVSSKSLSEIYAKLKEVEIERGIKQKEQYQQEMAKQNAEIESRERQIESKLQWDAEQKELDRRSQEKIQEMKVIGQSQFSEGNGYEQLMKLKAEQDRQDNMYRKILSENIKNQQFQDQAKSKAEIDQRTAEDKRSIEEQKIQLEKEKIAAKLKQSQNEVLIAKVNK